MIELMSPNRPMDGDDTMATMTTNRIGVELAVVEDQLVQVKLQIDSVPFLLLAVVVAVVALIPRNQIDFVS